MIVFVFLFLQGRVLMLTPCRIPASRQAQTPFCNPAETRFRDEDVSLRRRTLQGDSGCNLSPNIHPYAVEIKPVKKTFFIDGMSSRSKRASRSFFRFLRDIYGFLMKKETKKSFSG